MSQYIKVAGIVKESIVDGPGIRLVVFGQGCKHHCPGCHNPESHSFEGGELMEIDSIMELVKENPLLDGVTLSGGDPFEQSESFAILAKKVKELGLNIITYTGYTYEEILDNIDLIPGWKKLLYSTDILVDGKFEIDKKSLMLKFKGSSNQRIIDVNKSLKTEKIIVIG
ncbi:anaerobic ribonucleoside-triphosphate reductase activating protein [Anaerosalibacter bizertensis]|uniref:Anaerobic ribonucleoside-triphosphate reductase-activating protein n=1 Tax=Anaerosalibacter bizertensis TaxID=932217 RepID=A0A844FGJ9_9FIRM|nr:anaerobic ribonucleoside-triphosphate reductase activating protein [Anaerosalibacter bizertensis]MBV1819893.1 anaerobic ribonucleoside-triphosphate reductase activating protein [Bacteroidales bacterium MSK.15.36]HHV26307.1 anaerobic ribonucleoside-triphosphate reductase activating protein [Tissierellia bacterium]MBU5292563.1 anaerobic ribonucleoside-triphosphate reductase activating protein [Anaerosalibacter bizertensis]MCG4565899.1 anaerobic ribonucleoside-triphosphate reductase activating 